MPNGFQFFRTFFPGVNLDSLFFPTGFIREASAESLEPRLPSFTPGQEAARAAQLATERFEFTKETRATDLALASDLRTDALIRLREEQRTARAREDRALQREELRQEDARVREEQLLKDRQEFELVQRRQVIEDRAFAADLREALATADAKQRELEAAIRGAPRGQFPTIDQRGNIRFMRVGETPAEEALRLRAEALRFEPSAGTASRFTQIPGVFVGPGFRFQNVTEAQNFLVESRTRGQQRVRAPGVSRSFVGGIV